MGATTVLDAATMKNLSKEDRMQMNASLQNVYAGMIWMGNINRIALHKVDKHFKRQSVC